MGITNYFGHAFEGGVSTTAVALFSFEPVPRFFARKLHAGVWVGQVSLVLPSGEIANHANLMYFKFPWKVVWRLASAAGLFIDRNWLAPRDPPPH